MNDDYIPCVLRATDWCKGRYKITISGYANRILCNSKKGKIIKLFKKITKIDSQFNILIVWLPCKPNVDIPIKYKLDKN